jgi:hypothetical protein
MSDENVIDQANIISLEDQRNLILVRQIGEDKWNIMRDDLIINKDKKFSLIFDLNEWVFMMKRDNDKFIRLSVFNKIIYKTDDLVI